MYEKLPERRIKLKPRIRQLLGFVAESKKPLSSREIEKQATVTGKRVPYVYEMIENELCPTKYSEFYLFRWDQVPFSKKQDREIDNNRLRVINRLNEVLWIDRLKLDESQAEFKKSYDDKSITIESGSSIDPRVIKI
jgi:hypothetical protein